MFCLIYLKRGGMLESFAEVKLKLFWLNYKRQENELPIWALKFFQAEEQYLFPEGRHSG